MASGARAIVLVLAREAVSRLSGLRWTLALRRCCRCERLVGLSLWPWSGRLVVVTHTLCDACVARLLEVGPVRVEEDSPPRLEVPKAVAGIGR